VVSKAIPSGRLDGFRFAPDTTAGTSDARRCRRRQKALAGEIRRANKLAHAGRPIRAAADAAVRWISEPIAKIITGNWRCVRGCAFSPTSG
jgi:hypothetical protein